MKYIFAFIASLFLISSPALTFATETVLNTQGSLSDEQKTALAAEAAKMVADNAAKTNIPAPSPAEHVKQWVDIGAEIGSGLASTAKELGIAANEFVNTPVGKLTAGIIVWHFLGSSLIHLVFGFLWFVITVPAWICLYRRISSRVTRTEYEAGKGPDGIKKLYQREPIKLSQLQSFAYIVFGVGIVLVGLIATFTF